jgi:hypothetical protein
MACKGNKIKYSHNIGPKQHDLLAYFPLRLYYSTLYNSIVKKTQNYSLYYILML